MRSKNNSELDFIIERAVSKAQQRFFGIVDAYKNGKIDGKDVSQSVKDAAKSMSKKDIKDFAKTKHKNLPEKVKNGKKVIKESDIRQIIMETLMQLNEQYEWMDYKERLLDYADEGIINPRNLLEMLLFWKSDEYVEKFLKWEFDDVLEDYEKTNETREFTNKLLDMVDDEQLDANKLVKMFVKTMRTEDVKNFCQRQLPELFDENEED